MTERAFVTTAQVCEAAGISPPTAHRWSKAGLLPPYERLHGGRHGQFARWPAHAVEQARWVKLKISELYSFEEIRALIVAGEFEKSRLRELTEPSKPDPENAKASSDEDGSSD